MRLIPANGVVEIDGELDALLVVAIGLGVVRVKLIVAPLALVGLGGKHVDLIVHKGKVRALRTRSFTSAIVEYKLCGQFEGRIVSSIRPLVKRYAVVALVHGCYLCSWPIARQLRILRVDFHLAPVLLVAEIDRISRFRRGLLIFRQRHEGSLVGVDILVMEFRTVDGRAFALLVLNLDTAGSTAHGRREGIAVKVIALDGHLRH